MADEYYEDDDDYVNADGEEEEDQQDYDVPEPAEDTASDDEVCTLFAMLCVHCMLTLAHSSAGRARNPQIAQQEGDCAPGEGAPKGTGPGQKRDAGAHAQPGPGPGLCNIRCRCMGFAWELDMVHGLRGHELTMPIRTCAQEDRARHRLQFLLKQAEIFQHFVPEVKSKESKKQ